MANAETVGQFAIPIEVVQQLRDLAPRQAADTLFEAITGVDSRLLDNVISGRDPAPAGLGARTVRSNLAELLGVSKAAAASVLDTTPSRLSRSDWLDAHMLDRVHAAARTFVMVAAVLGFANAASWFRTPNAALGFRAPVELLGSSYGENRVENLVEGLLAGAIV